MPAERDVGLRIMILITDGEDSTNVRVEHILAWENDIEVYALGVTNGMSITLFCRFSSLKNQKKKKTTKQKNVSAKKTIESL